MNELTNGTVVRKMIDGCPLYGKIVRYGLTNPTIDVKIIADEYWRLLRDRGKIDKYGLRVPYDQEWLRIGVEDFVFRREKVLTYIETEPDWYVHAKNNAEVDEFEIEPRDRTAFYKAFMEMIKKMPYKWVGI